MSVDPFNDPDGRGKHPGDGDPIEIMVSNFEAEIERLREVLTLICLNASIQPDAAMDGTTDCYAVPMDDIQNGHAVLNTQRREPRRDQPKG